MEDDRMFTGWQRGELKGKEEIRSNSPSRKQKRAVNRVEIKVRQQK